MFRFSKSAFTKAMGVDGNVDRDNGRWIYGSQALHAISRRSKDVRDILRSPTSI